MPLAIYWALLVCWIGLLAPLSANAQSSDPWPRRIELNAPLYWTATTRNNGSPPYDFCPPRNNTNIYSVPCRGWPFPAGDRLPLTADRNEPIAWGIANYPYPQGWEGTTIYGNYVTCGPVRVEEITSPFLVFLWGPPWWSSGVTFSHACESRYGASTDFFTVQTGFGVEGNPVCADGFEYTATDVTNTYYGRCAKTIWANASSTPICKGNPIELSFARKIERSTDYTTPSGLGLTWEYRSAGAPFTPDYALWTVQRAGFAMSAWRFLVYDSLFNKYITFPATVVTTGPMAQTVSLSRMKDFLLRFSPNQSGWIAERDFGLSELSVQGEPRYRLLDQQAARVIELDAAGRLLARAAIDGGQVVTYTYHSATIARYPADRPPCGSISGTSSATLVPHCAADAFGRQITFEHDAEGRLTRLIRADGQSIDYVHSNTGHLAQISYPDGAKKYFHYGEAALVPGGWSNILTGISYELSGGVVQRYANFGYDTSARAAMTEHAGGADRHSMQYSSFVLGGTLMTGSVSVTPAIGGQFQYNFNLFGGVLQPTFISQPAGAGCSAANGSYTYDSQGYRTSVTDFNNNSTCFANDSLRNVEIARVEGLSGGAQCDSAIANPPAGSRKITTQWHPDWRLESRIAQPRKITTIVYNGQGTSCAPATAVVDGKPIAVVCSRTEQSTTDESGAAGFGATTTGTPRTWRYTYTTYGRVLTATDPNNRVTTYTFHADDDPDLGKRGNVASITNAANHVTRITDYNPHAQPTRIVDPNGVVTVLTYDPRMRLTSRTVSNEATVFGYDPVGQMTSVNLPDGAALTYTYDTARRLTAIADHKGNRIDYTLDAMGNRINEQVKDSGGLLVQNIARVIDALNRVQTITGSAGSM